MNHPPLSLFSLHTHNIRQSQSIQPAYLSSIGPHPSKPIHVFRKTDFCLSYSHLHPLYASLYKTLRHAPISHTTDTYTEALPSSPVSRSNPLRATSKKRSCR